MLQYDSPVSGYEILNWGILKHNLKVENEQSPPISIYAVFCIEIQRRRKLFLDLKSRCCHVKALSQDKVSLDRCVFPRSFLPFIEFQDSKSKQTDRKSVCKTDSLTNQVILQYGMLILFAYKWEKTITFHRTHAQFTTSFMHSFFSWNSVCRKLF